VKGFLAALMLMSGLFTAGGANAAVTMYIYQSGSDVVAEASGTYDVSNLTYAGIMTREGAVQPNGLWIGASATVLFWSGASCTGSIGPGSTRLANTNTGSPIGVLTGIPSYIYVPNGASTGTASATSTWTGTTLGTLGLTSGGTISCTWTGGSLNVSVSAPPGPAAVPTLSEWAQLMLALMVMMLIGWHFHHERSY